MHEDWFNIHIVRYDHHKDPDENVNIAGNSENAELIRKLITQLKTEGQTRKVTRPEDWR